MQRVRALDEPTPADPWREVPRNDEEFWPDVREQQQRLAKMLIEGTLGEEMTLLLGAPQPFGTRLFEGLVHAIETPLQVKG